MVAFLEISNERILEQILALRCYGKGLLPLPDRNISPSMDNLPRHMFIAKIN